MLKLRSMDKAQNKKKMCQLAIIFIFYTFYYIPVYCFMKNNTCVLKKIILSLKCFVFYCIFLFSYVIVNY